MKKRKICYLAACSLIFGGMAAIASCSPSDTTDVTTQTLTVSFEKSSIYIDESTTVIVKIGDEVQTDVQLEVSEGASIVKLEGNTVTGLAEGTATIKAKKAGCKAGTATITVTKAPVVEANAVLKFEDAFHESPTGKWGNEYMGGYKDTPVGEGIGESGGKAVEYQTQGCVETIKFTSDKAGKADLGFVMATVISDWMSGGAMQDMALKDYITISLNGTNLDLTDKVLSGDTEVSNYYFWDEVTFRGVDLVSGENSIVVTTVGQQGPNYDCVKVYGDYTITQIKGGSVIKEYEEIGTYSYFVNGYEWGPGVNRIVIDFGKNVKKADLANDLFEVKVTGSAATNRTVTSAYLVNDENEKDDSLTESTKVGLDLEFNIVYQDFWGFQVTNTNGASPFLYDQVTQLNNWDPAYGYEVKLASGKSLTIGDTAYSDAEKPFVVKGTGTRVIEATKDWGEAKSHTGKDGKTLTYKAYETEALKTDGGKNPLIIWLHGAGEGGTDPDIALLGNDVTNLGEEKIQKYFKTDTSAGAYVLAVQTPTMRMDDGTGKNGVGDARSIYTATLKETIDTYLSENTDVDTSEIILGGCSNGGYMTMNMAMEYPSFFKAYYPVCEAYKDSAISEEDIATLKDLSIWFTASADDPTVAPNDYVIPTYKRLMEAGASDVHFSYFEKVYGNDTGKDIQYNGHWSWIYALTDRCEKDQADYNNVAAPSTKDVLVDGEAVTMWEWLATR